MSQITETLLDDIRSRFAQVDSRPQQGPRVFFENAGGALTPEQRRRHLEGLCRHSRQSGFRQRRVA